MPVSKKTTSTAKAPKSKPKSKTISKAKKVTKKSKAVKATVSKKTVSKSKNKPKARGVTSSIKSTFNRIKPRPGKVKQVIVDVRPYYIPLTILISGILISCSVIIAFGDTSISLFKKEEIKCDSLEPLSKDCLRKYARDLDLNGGKFDKCLDESKYDEVIQTQMDKADELGVQGTPHVVIGKGTGDKFTGFYAGGAQGFDYYSELIERVKTEDLTKIRDEILAERYGTLAELTQRYKESYQEQGLSDDQLDEYAQASAQAEYDRYKVQEFSIGDGMVVGEADADVVLLVYSDFECPYCQSFAQDTVSSIESEYISKGEVRFVFSDLPLESIHTKARRAANAARCANEQGKFYDYHNTLFGVEANKS